MTDNNDIISYGEYQKLSEEEKQNYEPHWNSDGKSGKATRKGAKLPEVKSTIPVNEMKQAVPSTDQEVRDYWTYKDPTQYKLDLRNSKLDKKDTDAGDKTEAKGKTETTDKANQMSDSSKAKTDTTATDKSINPFQKEKEAADKAVEDASILLDRVKQLEAKAAKKHIDPTKNGNDILHITPDKELLELKKDTETLAKELGIDISSLLVMEEDGNTITPLKIYQLRRLKKINKDFIKIAEERLAAAKTIQQETQANYTKAEEEEAAKRKAEEAAKRKAESKPAPKEQDSESKAEKETEKDKTEDPLEKAEKLEQPESQTPADIKKFSKDLNRFVIQAYLNGDFGKKSSPNAIASMGFFILDKLGTALVNASEVARGMSPSAKSQWSKIIDIQTKLLGDRITSEWFLSLPREQQETLIRANILPGVQSASTIYNTLDPDAVVIAKQRDILGISKLSQEQKGVAQSNVNALLARKSELQTLINQLKSDQGWEVYAQAMNAVVGTAKGLSSLGVTDSSNSSSNKGFSDTLSEDVKTGKLPSAFVSGGISNNSTWNNSSAEALNKSNSINEDALALSKFKSGEEYAKATREAKKAANEQLIKRLEGQIEIIDKCIDSWGKDLDL